jgi:diguanylate cyclase (GGDEF)-like protein
MLLRSVGPSEIQRFLAPRERPEAFEADFELDSLFCQILSRADAFVPSEAGSILLEDPETAGLDPAARRLIFVACYGEKADALAGRAIPAREGIVGEVFRSGKPHISPEVSRDRLFARDFASPLNFRAESIICVPIRLEGETRGVIELINRKGSKRFTEGDLGLLEIFAGYISTSIRTHLDARRFKEMARLDDLTGLSNDRWLHHRLSEDVEAALRSKTDLSLVFFDLDNFKSVNDRYGHLAGSQSLGEMGPLLRRVVTLPGALSARYGGDEFVVILPGAGPQAAVGVAEAIRLAVERNVFLTSPGRGVHAPPLAGVITASLGVQSLSRIHAAATGETPEKVKDRLLREADSAMYLAKAGGKNRTVLFEGS